jgi:Tetratricopeptide repeat
MKALKKAATGPSASVVPKYLLGRAYRKAGDPQSAVQVLKTVVEANPDEFRACVELARAMRDMGEPYPKCIAVLKLSTLYGLSDPRYVGTLGGMLFMNGDFSEARTIFADARKREFPAQEESRVQFRPKNNANAPIKLTGQVTAVKVGYAFIDAPGYPSFFCPGSKFGRVIMRQGLSLEFEPVFTARGAMAEKIAQAAPAAVGDGLAAATQ